MRLVRSTFLVLVAAVVASGFAGCISTEVSEAHDSEDNSEPAEATIDEWGWGDDHPDAERDEMVVLVHGLGRTPFAMKLLERTLQDEGYRVYNWGYSSYCCTVEELGVELAWDLQQMEGVRPERIHFVGHSLGNIIIRQALGHAPPSEPGRVVMLAPPNQGSETADRYSSLFGWMLVPLEDLQTGDEGVVQELYQIEDREVGIIAGERDGKVDVDNTKLETQDDHEVVETFHTWMMNRSEVQELILDFLRYGEF